MLPHKTCAEQSETDPFITVDGDNIVMDEFSIQALESKILRRQ